MVSIAAGRVKPEPAVPAWAGVSPAFDESKSNQHTAGSMSTERIAVLPMYDFPDVADAHDLWWRAIAARLRAAGVCDVPDALCRDVCPEESWSDPRLLLGQACEYPLAMGHGAFVHVVATPCYGAPGCDGARYRSAIVVRAADPARSAADLRGRRGVVNDSQSNSGMNLLRATLAPIARGDGFFETVAVSGSHWRSARLVADGDADAAAIDCVTYAHLRRCDPALVAKLRVLDWTPSSPSLPYVTARSTPQATVQALRQALAAAVVEPGLAAARERLFLTGFDLNVDAGFTAVLELEQRAVQWRYPVLR
jgi:ABC-type phosphate/phosphonate transport system substrate-binding protein